MSCTPVPGGTLTQSALLDIVTRYTGATICIVDRQLRILYVNEAYATWFKVQPQALLGQDFASLYSPDAQVEFLPHVHRALAGHDVSYQRQVRNAEGQEFWYSISLKPWRDADGVVAGLVNSALGVHELKVTTEALRAANQKLSSHMENSPLAVVELDARLGLVHCSSRATEWFGWRADEHQGQSVLRLLGDGQRTAALRAALERLLSGRERQNRADASALARDGSVQHCVWFNSALVDARGETVSIMCQVEDVTERVMASEQLMRLAQRDSLTGLLNRGAFMVRAQEVLDAAESRGAPVVVLFMDLDGFKAINDHHGHHVGDVVLRLVAQRLASVVREDDILARLGGDEFTVMMHHEVGAPELDALIDRILSAFTDPFVLPEGRMALGVSVGVASHPPLPARADELLTRADHAMYEVKRGGKGGVRHAAFAPASVPARG